MGEDTEDDMEEESDVDESDVDESDRESMEGEIVGLKAFEEELLDMLDVPQCAPAA